jgi:hypothetical protein
LSRLALAAVTLFTLEPVFAFAQSGNLRAEEAMDRYHQVTAVPGLKCGQVAKDSNEIVVCSEGRSKYLLPLPDEREPRDGPRLATGEVPLAVQRPAPVCPPTGCTGINLFEIITIIGTLNEAIKDGQD